MEINCETIEDVEYYLRSFYNENGRSPNTREMLPKYGLPSRNKCMTILGTRKLNDILDMFDLPINKIWEELDDNETCYNCGISLKNNRLRYENGKKLCHNCYRHKGYRYGNLNKESSTAKGTISEQIVKNVLNLEERHDCNFACGFGYKVDLYHKDKYWAINVKDSKLYYSEIRNSYWHFGLHQKEMPDTYVMLAYDEDRKNILRVWITNAIDDLVFNEKTETLLKSLSISNTYERLNNIKPWEVDVKPYNDMLHSMSKKRKETNGKECFLSSDDLNRCD